MSLFKFYSYDTRNICKDFRFINFELISESWAMSCHNIVYDEITLDMMHKIETMKDTEEKSCKLFCNMDKASCNSFHFDRNLRECMLFRLKLVEFQLKAKLIGAPKGCGASFPPCVSTEQLKIESFFCTAHLLFPNNDSRDPVFLHMHMKGNSCVFIFFVFVCRIMYLIFLFFGLWSQSADKLTIHSIPCSWIL